LVSGGQKVSDAVRDVLVGGEGGWGVHVRSMSIVIRTIISGASMMKSPQGAFLYQNRVGGGRPFQVWSWGCN
jgi:hypothetical protein